MPRGFAGPGLGCGLAAGSARAEKWAELVFVAGPRNSAEIESVFTFLFFNKSLFRGKWINDLKKI